MATFTVDLLTGNIYLFSGNFSGSGSTPTSGSTYPQVQLYTNLPAAGTVGGQIYVVRQGTAGSVLNRKSSGFYFSTGAVWRFLGDTPEYFKSDTFQVYDNVNNTKGLSFVTSGITSGFKRLKVQDSDGTIAYLSDLNAKVDLSAFNDYTGTTAPATYLSKSSFNSFTGTTLPANYYNKTQINAYTGATYSLIGTKQNTLIAGYGINISGNVISVSGITPTNSNSTLQLLDTSGGTNVNTISSTPIVWTSQVFSGTSLNYTGGSRIYIKANGNYDISYLLNTFNTTNTGKNIGTVIRKNGNTTITPLSSASFSQDITNNSNTNIMPQYLVQLLNNDYVELVGFRIGNSGVTNTVVNGSWIKIKKI